MIRRTLLGVVTALLVARPLVLGEDPGLLTTGLTDPSNLWLTLLWMLAGIGWAVWRGVSGQRRWPGGVIEGGLLTVIGITFCSAFFAASYKHPAYLIAWEWVVFLIGFGLVRQLVREPEENRHLLAALLASAVTVAAYGIYQYAVEMPAMRDTFVGHPERMQEFLASKGILVEPDSSILAAWMKRIQDQNIYASFAHPNSFAGYLALLLPAWLGAAILLARHRASRWHVLAAIGGFVLVAVALVLTHSRGGILGISLVGVAVLLAWKRPKWTIVGLGGAASIVAGILVWQSSAGRNGLELASQSMNKRADYWSGAWAMIRDSHSPSHFWLGVGPGNFGRYYSRYMRPTADEQITDPHNFALETWATTGVFGCLALLGTLTVFFWLTRSAWDMTTFAETEESSFSPQEAIPRRARTLWEFYLGGSFGLFLGFLISGVMEIGTPTGQSLYDRIQAWAVAKLVHVVLCCLLWFPAFALLERVRWPRKSLLLATTAGVAALLLNLCVSGGIGFPSVALPLWVMAAIALNALPRGEGRLRAPNWLASYLPLPLAAAVALVFLFGTFVPVTSAFPLLQRENMLRTLWTIKFDAELRQATAALDGADDAHRNNLEHKLRLVVSSNGVFVRNVVAPVLRDARKQDPGDVAPVVAQAFWDGELWKLGQKLDPGGTALSLRQSAVRWADQAIKMDPESTEPYWTLYRLNLLFAAFADRKVTELYGYAANALKQAVQRNPTDASWQFALADVLYKAEKPVEAREHAHKAQRLDDLSTDPARKLTEPQREQVRQWLSTRSGS